MIPRSHGISCQFPLGNCANERRKEEDIYNGYEWLHETASDFVVLETHFISGTHSLSQNTIYYSIKNSFTHCFNKFFHHHPPFSSLSLSFSRFVILPVLLLLHIYTYRCVFFLSHVFSSPHFWDLEASASSPCSLQCRCADDKYSRSFFRLLNAAFYYWRCFFCLCAHLLCQCRLRVSSSSLSFSLSQVSSSYIRFS